LDCRIDHLGRPSLRRDHLLENSPKPKIVNIDIYRLQLKSNIRFKIGINTDKNSK